MRIQSVVLGCIVVASIFSGGPASALEARETRTHMILDVPATWVVEHQGEFVRAHPTDKSFQVSVAGTGPHAAWTEASADVDLQSKARWIGALSQLHVDTHARKIEWGNFTGFEVFGTAKMANGYDTDLKPAKWFGIVLVDKRDAEKGLYAVGIGTPAGYDRNEPAIYTAMHTLRPYTE